MTSEKLKPAGWRWRYRDGGGWKYSAVGPVEGGYNNTDHCEYEQLYAHPTPTAADTLAWAVSRWNAEVKNRPLVNVHRRSLDDTWRQVIRHLGGDPVALCGCPAHDDLLVMEKEKQP